MPLSRREFLQALAAASTGGFALDAPSAQAARREYDLPAYGNLTLLHYTDCHAQLLPLHYREPSANIGVGAQANRPPHLVGEALLRHYGIRPGSREAHALTHLGFERAARRYGRMGGFAHLATLVRRLRAERHATLLLDGGDTWQGSASALWTRGADMIAAQKLLGVDVMTAHWEFTYGAERVREAAAKELGGIEFLAQNVETSDFGDPVFKPHTLREVGGVPVGIIGQAYPYTPIANPRYFVPEWRFGIEERRLQKHVDDLRAARAQVVVLLSHNGFDIDLKLASRVRGIDVILGGHTHDAVPQPRVVAHAGGGRTLVTCAGSHGKFLGVMDLDVRGGSLAGYRYRLVPVFADLLPPDPDMARLIEAQRAPYAAKLSERLASTDALLYRRGNFNGSFDQVIVEALLEAKGAQIALSPGFRWGATLLPGEAVTLEDVMNQTAITYAHTTVTDMTGATLKTVLEDVADNLFNPDPYLQQGGDMVRLGGLTCTCAPAAPAGRRIGDLRLAGVPIDAGRRYRVAAWGSVSEAARDAGTEPVWEVVSRYLRDRKVIRPARPNRPRLKGMAGNLGWS